jgi:hypothetical protein
VHEEGRAIAAICVRILALEDDLTQRCFRRKAGRKIEEMKIRARRGG